MNRPFYSPRAALAGESSVWTLPVEGLKMQLSGGGLLAVERFTTRYESLPQAGSNRKCFVHPDWRLGARIKKHGFQVNSCPVRLRNPAWGCASARHPAMRRPCLDLCGVWGNETCDACIAPPAPGCSFKSPREHTAAGGEIMGGVDLAHFRIAPAENRLAGSREARWLRNLSATVRPLVEACNS